MVRNISSPPNGGMVTGSSNRTGTAYSDPTAEERLFLNYAHSYSLERARLACEQDPELRTRFEIARVFDPAGRFDRLSLEEFRREYRRTSPAIRRTHFYWYLFLRQNRLTWDELDSIESHPATWRLDASSPELRLVRFLKGDRLYRRGQTKDALRHLEQLSRPTNRPDRSSPFEDFVTAATQSGLGYLTLQVGDFNSAHEHLTRAWEVSRHSGFGSSELRDSIRLGELYGAMGQFSESLRWLLDEERRERARAEGKVAWLAQSHNCALRVALDAERLELAREELMALQELIARHPHRIGQRQHAYARLHAGEILSQEGRDDPARNAILDAHGMFAGLTPVWTRGVLEADVGLLVHLVRRQVMEREVIRSQGPSVDLAGLLDDLLDRARAAGNIALQLRTAIVRACLWLESRERRDPEPYRRADARFRTELVNDPSLLSAMLHQLYELAGDTPGVTPESIALRIRNIDPAIEGSCYPGIHARLMQDELRRDDILVPILDRAGS